MTQQWFKIQHRPFESFKLAVPTSSAVYYKPKSVDLISAVFCFFYREDEFIAANILFVHNNQYRFMRPVRKPTTMSENL